MASNKIAYGLAKKHGINTDGMSPKEVWAALKDKGVDIDAESQNLKAKEMGLSQDSEWSEEEAFGDFYEGTDKKAKKKRYVELPKKEYAKLCSAIRTKYRGKIPGRGHMLYGDHYYEFKHSKENKITCIGKILIDGNEEKINKRERRYLNDKKDQ